MQKKRYVLALKLRPVKTFKGEKCKFTVEKIIKQQLWVSRMELYMTKALSQRLHGI